jgi:hypothetical protein
MASRRAKPGSGHMAAPLVPSLERLVPSARGLRPGAPGSGVTSAKVRFVTAEMARLRRYDLGRPRGGGD